MTDAGASGGATEVHPTDDDLREVSDLYDRGRYLDAYRQAQALAPLEHWRGASARTLAGRLASNLGAARLGIVLRYLAYREHPNEPRAIYFHVADRANLWGPLNAIEFQHAKAHTMHLADNTCRAEWHAMESMLFARLRDWERCDVAMAQAMEFDPTSRWLRVEQAVVLEFRDRYQDALDIVDALLLEQPWYRPAVQERAHLLQLLGRDEESLHYLYQALEHLQCYPLLEQCLELELDREHFDAGRALLARLDEFAPLQDAIAHRRLEHARMEIALNEDRIAAAIVHARAVKRPFHSMLADNLANNDGERGRVRLDVPFVRQHHMTCGPATLDALCRYYGVAARQPEIIEQIWFDGTSDYRERRWAQSAGFIAREFALTWDAARQLLERGLAFALATVETTSAHLQAVIGFDATRRTLLIRDPTVAQATEFLRDQMLAHYASTGPRAFVFLPQDRAAQLAGIDLPEAALYDELYQLCDALEHHDRDRAQTAMGALHDLAPGSRLTLQAERILGYYDGDEVRVLAAIDALIALFPNDSRLIFARQLSLHRLGRREEREQCLAEACSNNAGDIALMAAYSESLLEDWRNRDRAYSILRGLMRRAPYEPEHYLQIASIRWRSGQFDNALMLYRLAACLAEMSPRYVRTFFNAARLRNRTDEALSFLRERFNQFGHLSPAPAIALIQALDCVERNKEIDDVAQQALRKRKDDPQLALELSEYMLRAGRTGEGKRYLERAKGRVQLSDWLHNAAQVARLEGDTSHALECLHQILDDSPLDMRAVRAAVQLLTARDGTRAALAFVNAHLERFPVNLDLLSLALDESRSEPTSVRLAAADRLLHAHPGDTWARRERALILAEEGRIDEAMGELNEAIQRAPMESANYSVAGALSLRRGQLDEAQAFYARAIRQDADNTNAIVGLIANATDAESVRDAVSLIEGEFERQVLDGDGLLAYAQAAEAVLQPSDLLDSLARAHAARPDLWQTWVSYGEQLIASGDVERAIRVLREASERFVLLPRVWLALADAYRHGEQGEREHEALLQAVRINPDFDRAVAALATHYEHRGQVREARHVIERAMARNANNERFHAYLADYLWMDGDRDGALHHIRIAAEADPDYEWAWNQLRRWAGECGQNDLPRQVAQQRVTRHPGAASSYLLLAQMLDDANERLRCIDDAIEREPNHIGAHQQRIETLVALERHDEVADVLAQPVWRGRAPVELRAMQAWAEQTRGNVDAAREVLNAVVASDPYYYQGWKLLADLHCDLKHNDDYFEAATRMRALRPRDPVALAYLGDAAIAREELDLARECFDAAATVSPNYLFAQSNRFDLALRAEDYGCAELALESFQIHGEPVAHAYREVTLAVTRNDSIRALKALRTLLTADDDDNWMVDESITRFVNQWGRETVHEALCDRLHDDLASACRSVGYHWGQGIGPTASWQHHGAQLQRLMECKSSAGLGGAVAYLEALEVDGDPRLIDAFVDGHGEALRADEEAWATVTNTYRARGFADTACQWAQDWCERDGLSGWSLGQVALACWDAKRVNQAVAAHERALANADETTTVWHRTWYALGCALQGDGARCARQLNAVGEQELSAYGDAVRALAKAANAALNEQQGIDQARALFHAARVIYRPVADETLRWLAAKVREVILERAGGSLLSRLTLRARLLI